MPTTTAQTQRTRTSSTSRRAIMRRLPGNASADVQLAALLAYKDKVSTTGVKTLTKITRSAKEQTVQEKMKAHRAHWAAERNIQIKERKQAEADLKRAFDHLENGLPALRSESRIRSKTGGLARDTFSIQCRTFLSDLPQKEASRAEETDRVMSMALALQAKTTAHKSRSTRQEEELELMNAIESMKAYLDEALTELDTENALLDLQHAQDDDLLLLGGGVGATAAPTARGEKISGSSSTRPTATGTAIVSVSESAGDGEEEEPLVVPSELLGLPLSLFPSVAKGTAPVPSKMPNSEPSSEQSTKPFLTAAGTIDSDSTGRSPPIHRDPSPTLQIPREQREEEYGAPGGGAPIAPGLDLDHHQAIAANASPLGQSDQLAHVDSGVFVRKATVRFGAALPLFPEASPELVSVFREALLRLAQQYDTQVLQTKEQLATLLRTHVGTKEDFDRAVWLAKQYDPLRHPQTLRCRELFTSRLMLEHPRWTELDAQTMIRIVEESRQLDRKQTVLLQNANTEIANVLNQFREALKSEQEIMEAEAQRATEEALDAERRRKMHQELDVLRQEKDKAEAVRLQEKMEEEEQLRKENLRKEQLYFEDLAVRVEEAARRRQMRAMEAAMLAKELELEQVKEREQKKEEAAFNATRMDFRKRALERKQSDRKIEKELEQVRGERKQQTLDRFFENVDRKIGVERDSLRAQQGTVASTQDSNDALLLHEQARQLTEGKMAGYSDTKVLKDPRFRLQQALVSAGLHGTTYAQHLLHQGTQRGNAFGTSDMNPLKR